MMNTQETFFALLRKAIGLGECVERNAYCVENPQQMEALLQLCQRQGTAALVFNELLQLRSSDRSISDSVLLGDSRSSSEAFYAALKQHCMQNMMNYERLLSLLKETWKGLEQGGVQPVVLKGFGLATLYPTPYLRAWGDLDIYVGPKQYHEAAEVLRCVFPDAKHHDEEWEDLKHYNFVLPNGLIEMHRSSVKLENPRDNAYFWQLEQEAMKPENVQWVEIEDVKFAIPEAKFNMLFTFFHAWFHFIEEGLGFKQICDVALLANWTFNHQSSIINHQSISTYLNTNLKKLKLQQPWQLMGYVCVHAIGLRPDEWPLYHENAWLRKHGPLFLDRVMTEGLMRPKDFGESKDRYEAREKARQMNILARKWKTLKSRFAGAMEVYPYSPQYARHMMWSSIVKGVRRTMRREEMINY